MMPALFRFPFMLLTLSIDPAVRDTFLSDLE
jgi:hypothetical protein